MDNFHNSSALWFDGNTSVPKRHKATVATVFFFRNMNPLLINKLVRSRRLDFGLVLFFACLWTSTWSPFINSCSQVVSNLNLLFCGCFRILYNLLNIGTEQYIHQSLYADRPHGSAGKQPSFNPVANMVFNFHRLFVI